jgi:8-oxo-dGTP pyrophosphatase MutT (NUDIX family)
MLERHGGIAFPGAHAFPGGVVETTDLAPSAASLPSSQCWASEEDADRPPDALPYWMAAVRELFEEVGILLATDRGRPLVGALRPELVTLRQHLLAGEAFDRLMRAADLVPGTDQLWYFARWITPVASPRRWDTRFLVGRLPDGQEAIADGTETVSCRWFTPRAALTAYGEGRIELAPPTVRTLDDLARFPTVAAVLADASRRSVRAVTPELVETGGLTAIRYPDNTGCADQPARDLVLQAGRWRPRGD